MISAAKCTRCKETKPAAKFNREKRKKNGLQSWCRECMKFNNRRYYAKDPGGCVSRSRQWQRDNPEKVKQMRERSRFARYGITQDDFAQIVERQGGVCAICQNGDRELVIDHCHDTGEVRGALCNKCNKGIGLLGDDPEAMIRAASYLRESGK
jgi:hypothetical protein